MKFSTFFFLFLVLTACATAEEQTTRGTRESAVMPTAQSLLSTEWLLEDLGGAGVLDRIQATLSFLDQGRVAGNGSCNRFTGSVEIGGGKIRFGQMASTRRACVPAVMDQEAKYLKALEDAERITIEGPYLLIYSRGFDKPLRFSKIS